MMTLNSESDFCVERSKDATAQGPDRFAASSVEPNPTTRKENSELTLKTTKEYVENLEEEKS